MLGYAGVVATMLGCALAVDDQQVGAQAARGIRRGAAMFVVSDGLIGTSKFLVPDAGPAVRGALDAAVTVTYTWAQARVTAAVLAAAPAPHSACTPPTHAASSGPVTLGWRLPR